jgi:hypothetical protein
LIHFYKRKLHNITCYRDMRIVGCVLRDSIITE